ncbi:hypothetical protein IFM89_038911 [Coptis chinensis]|uniref:Uncharacterized protein n=1 Tax=Coptis chinensis TaxID=261450 RepID=A0A835LXW6_9MAGN|nr:hypothetical protein IFM89_038911 [Coptis chinensis]
MLLRSSSTPILGSLLSSLSETPNRDFDATNNNINKPSLSNSGHKRLSFLHGAHPSFSSFACNSSSFNGFSDIDQETNTGSLGGLRRAQSAGNLEGLIDMDEFHTSNKPSLRSSRKPHHSVLQTIPSFSVYSTRNEEDEEEEEMEEEVEGELSEKYGFLKRAITIGDNINGEFSFGKNMDLVMEEEGGNELNNFGDNEEEEEGEPKSPPLYLAKGLGMDFGFGGGDFSIQEIGGGDRDNSSMEEYYKEMVEENPGNSLFLRNYAQFLYQSKGDLQRAEEYYSRAILSDPGDGEMLSQYAKIVWELHHDHERASSYFERAVQVAPQDSHVHAAYASFLWETEEEEEEDNLQPDRGGISHLQSRVMTFASA